MSSIVDKYTGEVRENRPIEHNGLTFYPLRVRDYGLYTRARPAYELLLSSLPPQMARHAWCACLWEMDRAMEAQGQTPFYFPAAMLVLARALHLQPIGAGSEARYPLRPIFTEKSHALKHLEIQLPDSCVPALLNMQELSRIRELIAAQNCYTIPDENWNPELLRAQEYLNAQKGTNGVKPDLEAAVYAVAVGTGRRAAEIWDWPIREFIKAQEAIGRKYDYQIYTGAEMSGFIKFRHGNPHPSWLYPREAELPGGFMSVSELDAGHRGLLGDATQTSKE